jgi:hypothetical protein
MIAIVKLNNANSINTSNSLMVVLLYTDSSALRRASNDKRCSSCIEHDDTYEEVCSICGCFGGLIINISYRIPGMKDVRKLRNHYPECGERVLNLYLECNFRE